MSLLLRLSYKADHQNSFIDYRMKHLAAYLLLGLGGNTSPSADDVKEVLSSVGIDADDDRLDKLIGELKGKDLQEVSPSEPERTSWILICGFS